MTDTSQQQRATPTGAYPSVPREPTPTARAGEPPSSVWSGWVVFAAVMLLLSGGLHVIEGFVALLNRTYYVVTDNGLVIQANYTAWGVAHLVLGGAAFLAGLGLMTGNLAARIVGVIVAVLSAIASMTFLAAYPVWSIVVIAIDVVAIYAISVHGGELKSQRL